MSDNAAAAVVGALASARRIMQLYPQDHVEHLRAVEALVGAVTAAVGDTGLSLNIHEGRLYAGSTPVATDAPGAQAVVAVLESRDVESLTFECGFDDTDARGLVEVLTSRHTHDDDLSVALRASSVQHARFTHVVRDGETASERSAQRDRDRALYVRMVTVLRAMMSQIAQGANPDLAESTELVEGLLSRLMEDRAAVMGLATIRGVGERELLHSLNVMIYTCVLGERLGLPDESMVPLGTAALLHDIGKSQFAPQSDVTGDAVRREHPQRGAHLLEQLALEDPAPMLVAFEHHMSADGTGWPARDAGYVAHPYSRMVAVANRYENLTNPVTLEPALTPDRALATLLWDCEAPVDPFFARLFAGAMGVFPVGCTVRLSDNSIAVVRAPGDDPLAPIVNIVFDACGRELDAPVEVVMSETDVHIVEVVDPEVLALQVAEKL